MKKKYTKGIRWTMLVMLLPLAAIRFKGNFGNPMLAVSIAKVILVMCIILIIYFIMNFDKLVDPEKS
ncbi:MAG: hypothetical protein Sapg2KO_11660 [Saprospiraceae bacterium]